MLVSCPVIIQNYAAYLLQGYSQMSGNLFTVCVCVCEVDRQLFFEAELKFKAGQHATAVIIAAYLVSGISMYRIVQYRTGRRGRRAGPTLQGFFLGDGGIVPRSGTFTRHTPNEASWGANSWHCLTIVTCKPTSKGRRSLRILPKTIIEASLVKKR